MTRVFGLLTMLLGAVIATISPATAEQPLLEKQDLFEAKTEGYFTYRIPGLLVTRSGAVLATVEARRGRGGDWDDNDVLLRRSVDGGRTWDKPRPLVLNKTYGPGPISNFVLLGDGQGTVHALFCYDYRRVFHLRSTDEGRTFSAPVEITVALEALRREYPWRVIATGPSHGTVLRSGRMIVPIWMSDGSGKEMGKGKLGHRPSVVSLIYSDDQGKTWQTGAIVCRDDQRFRNPSETVMVELADGRVLFNIRSESAENRRLVSISPDGVRGWSPPQFEQALLEPVCMASLIRWSWPSPGVPGRILFANPDNLENELVRPGGNLAHDRKRLTVKMSTDECRTWPVSKVLEQGPSGYSDLAVLPDGTALCFYECGMVGGMTITRATTLARFNLEWLLAPPPKAAGPQTAPEVGVGGRRVSTANPPAGLVLREHLGLLTAAAVDGQVVHRARPPVGNLFETRATITPAGDYLLMFPEGTHYGGSRGKKVNEMIAYRSTDRGRTWAGPTVPFQIDYSQHGFIPLIPRGSKRIYAFGTQPIPGQYEWRRGLQENAPIGFRWSDDDGHTWSQVTLIRPVNDPEYKGMSVMRMCETQRGTWLLGTHEGDWSVKPLRTRQYVLRSEDQGRTWTLLPGPRPNGWFAEGFDRMDEGRPIALGGDRVLLMARTPEGHLFTAWSADDGRTWTKPAASPLVHPDAPPMLFHLSDGKTLVALHHNRHAPAAYTGLSAKMEGMKDRSEIWAATSTDGGHTWSEPRFLLANAAAPDQPNAWFNYQCSYLDAFVDAGVLHVFMPHRWNQALHLTLKEADLARLPTASELRAAAAAREVPPSPDLEADRKALAAGRVRPVFETLDLFAPTERQGQHCYYRIPKLVVSAKGTVFAFPEERTGGIGDDDKQNLVVRRSLDHGKTWLPLDVLKSDPNPRVSHVSSAAVADQQTGRVFLFFGVSVVIHSHDIVQWEANRSGQDPAKVKRPFVEAWCVEHPAEATALRKQLAPDLRGGSYFIFTDDEGQSWSEPVPCRVLTRNPVSGQPCALGLYPGVGIQLTHGPHAGRLVVPGRLWSKSGAFDLYAYSHNAVAISDDHGRTWTAGGLAQAGTGEACVVELADGGVYLNSRNESLRFRGQRAWDRSDDGAESFIESGFDRTLVEPHCHAALARYSFAGPDDRSRVLFCNPAVTSNTPGHFDGDGRRRLTVRLSYDECRSWPQARLVEAGPAGYSSLAVTTDRTILCVYEGATTGKSHSEGRLVLARFNLAWLTAPNGP